MIEKHYRRAEIEALTGLSRSTIYDQMSRGLFPKPIKLTEKTVAWPESAIDAWLKSRSPVTDDDLAKARIPAAA